MSTLCNAIHPANVDSLKVTTPSGIDMPVRSLQPAKAAKPMELTLLGI